jgi:hypothetical protein
MIAPSDWIVKLVAATEPNRTPVAARKPVPKIVTCVSPVVGPPAEFKVVATAEPPAADAVLRPITVRPGPDVAATELLNVNWSAADVCDAPRVVATITSTVPSDSAGVTAMIDVLELTVKFRAAVAPNDTPVTLVKLVPVIVIVVPPTVEPIEAFKFVTTGIPGAANVNWSLDETAELPLGVVTVTSTSPAACAGAIAVIELGEFSVNDAAGTPPKLTAETPIKFEPLIVTDVPPAVVPVAVPRLVTTGAGDWKVNRSAAEVSDVPAALVTVTSTVPADSAAVMAVIEVGELTVKERAATEPNITDETLLKFVPMITTDVPPEAFPEVTPRPVTAGVPFGAVNVNWSVEPVVETPLAAVTTMSTVPGMCPGETALMEVGEFTTYEVASVPPNVTAVTPLNPVPVIVTLVPPEPVPVDGETPVMVGPFEE